MEASAAIACLRALAHEGRLAAFRLLVQAGVDGLAAGEIARRLNVLPNTLSTHLSVLSHAGLITAVRDGRSIVYAAQYGAMTDLLGFLLSDCCGGAAEVCAPLSGLIAASDQCGAPESAA